MSNIGATVHDPPTHYEESLSQGFPFSVFFQPSTSASTGLSTIRPSPAPAPVAGPGSGNTSNGVLRSSLSSAALDSTSSASLFIGFSWGPLSDAFPPAVPTSSADPEPGIETPSTRPTLIPVPIHVTPAASLYHGLLAPTPNLAGGMLSTPRPSGNNTAYNYSTPRRPYALSPHHTLQRTSTIRRSNAMRRNVSDREAMKQLVDCVGMSARKKVLESGRKPRVIGVWSLGGKSGFEGTGKSLYRKQLRFDPLATPIPRPDYGALSSGSEMGTVTTARSHRNNYSSSSSNDQPRAYAYDDANSEGTSTDSEDGIGGPPSPSPSPRPGSAMSMISMSRRSGTPTTTTMLTMSGSVHNSTTTGTLSSHRTGGNISVTGTGYLTIPSATSAGALNVNFKLGIPPPVVATTTTTTTTVGGNRTASLAIASARPRSNVESQEQSASLLQPVIQNDNIRNLAQDDDDDDDDDDDKPAWNVSYVTPSQSQQSQWRSADELERRHVVMMGDIEDLEERFQGLNASL